MHTLTYSAAVNNVSTYKYDARVHHLLPAFAGIASEPRSANHAFHAAIADWLWLTFTEPLSDRRLPPFSFGRADEPGETTSFIVGGRHFFDRRYAQTCDAMGVLRPRAYRLAARLGITPQAVIAALTPSEFRLLPRSATEGRLDEVD